MSKWNSPGGCEERADPCARESGTVQALRQAAWEGLAAPPAMAGALGLGASTSQVGKTTRIHLRLLQWEILTGRCEGKRGKSSFSTKSRSRRWPLTPYEGNQPRQGIISAAGLVEGLPAHGMEVGMKQALRCLPTQKILGFSCSVVVELRKDHRGSNMPHATPRNTS